MSAKVGADVENLCGKCGDVWHVVVAKVGDRIVKVQCKQCGGVHRHRPPGGPEPKPRAAGGVRATTPRRAQPAPPAEPLLPADPSRPVRPYRPADTWQPGDRLTHPTFGAGVVESFPGPGKMQVFFPSGRRVLALTKAASTLVPPPPRRDDDGQSGPPPV